MIKQIETLTTWVIDQLRFGSENAGRLSLRPFRLIRFRLLLEPVWLLWDLNVQKSSAVNLDHQCLGLVIHFLLHLTPYVAQL